MGASDEIGKKTKSDCIERYIMSYVEKQIEELKKITNKKLINLNKIIEYTTKQTKAIEDYNVDELNKLVDLKQIQIDEVVKLDVLFGQKFEGLKEELGVHSINQAKENLAGFRVIQVFIDEVNDAVSRILEMEQRNSELGKELQRLVKDKMRQTNQSKKLSQGYDPHGGSIPAFFDKKK